MKFGLCCDPNLARTAAEAGYDYFEWSVAPLLNPGRSTDAFHNALRETRKAPIPCPAVNCFVPGDLRITGPEADLEVLRAYVTLAFERAQEAGVGIIVFGSGGARKVPEGFDPSVARQQIVDFCRMFAPIAGKNNVTVVLEPLNKRECNILNGTQECADIVREVDHPAFRLLVDAYHWALEGESPEVIERNGDLIQHMHIATVPERLAPGAEECDFSGFFRAIKNIGYEGRLSIEGKGPHTVERLSEALRVMKTESS